MLDAAPVELGIVVVVSFRHKVSVMNSSTPLEARNSPP
jgi:hypothetical protein